MSSSRHSNGVKLSTLGAVVGNDNDNGDEDIDAADKKSVADQVRSSTSDNSSTFRRWSRNLSAQRHKELNRLNQIERRRQFLELKRQNDLFDQMRVSVKAAAAAATSASEKKKILQQEMNSRDDDDESGLDNEGKVSSVGQQQVLRQLKDDSTMPIKVSDTGGESESATSLTKLRLTSPTGMSVHEQLPSNNDDDQTNTCKTVTTATTATNKIRSRRRRSKDDERDKSNSGRLNSPAHANLTSSSSHNNNNNPPAPRAKLQQNAQVEASIQAKSDLEEGEGEEEGLEQLEVNAGDRISGDLLARFVSQRVPKNKRVLCLIVRDKMSRLNKAKSYFYPTYYLFIQTILDIDESGNFLLLLQQQQQQQHQLTAGLCSESECAAQLSCSPAERTTNQLLTSTSIDYNNSFSASSSISADMLFIGTTTASGAATAATRNKTNADPRSIEMSGNSYSDIEVAYVGSDDEDEDEDENGNENENENEDAVAAAAAEADGIGYLYPYPCLSNAQVDDQLERKRKQRVRDNVNSPNDHLQGRDSPLVFPNLDNSSNKESESAAGIQAAATSSSAKIKSTVSLTGTNKLATGGSLYQSQGKVNLSKLGDSNEATFCDDESLNRAMDDADQETTTNSSRRKKKKKKTTRVDLSGDSLSIDGDADSNEDEGDELDYDNGDNFHQYDQRVEIKLSGELRKRKEPERRSELKDHSAGSLFENDRNPYTGTNGVLLTGRRRKKAKTYLIGPGEFGYTRKNSICKLKSNVLGTQFNAIRLNNNSADNLTNDRCNIASINYETNVLGFKGPRKMRVFLAKDTDGEAKNLIELHKKCPSAVIHLKNMTPSWNIESQSYVLNFHGRVTQASVKNFQLIEFDGDNNQSGESSSKQMLKESGGQRQSKEKRHTSLGTQQQSTGGDGKVLKTANSMQSRQTLEHELHNGQQSNMTAQANNGSQCELGILDKSSQVTGNKTNLTYNSSIVMQFGRISNHEFTCDVTYPLSILQAFTIALSSFDSKLACE